MRERLVKKISVSLLLVAVLAGLAFGAMSLLRSSTADAGSHGATRSFSATSVPAGGELDVTIDTSGSGFGQVVETLPAGFTYVSSTLSESAVETDGQTVTFTLFPLGGEFTYTVTVSDMAKAHEFNGVVVDQPAEGEALDERPIGGEFPSNRYDTVPTSPDVGATRSFSPESVAPRGEVVVTINVANYGGVGELVETLPDGFTYVSTTHGDVVRDGQELSFSLVGETSFTYTVTAPNTPKDYTFRGTLTDSSRNTHDVGGPPITVTSPPDAGATRSFSPESVAPMGEVVVTITLANYGGVGELVETLPDGFTYVSTTHGDVVENGQELSFSLVGETSFTYTVTAPNTPKDYTFSGTLTDSSRNTHDVGGPPITVTAPPDAGATRSFSPESVAPSGRGRGDHHPCQLWRRGRAGRDLARRVHLCIHHSRRRCEGRPGAQL